MSVTPRRLVTLAVLGAAIGGTGMAATAQAARPTCHGLPVTTLKSSGLIIGTAKRDVIRLTGPGHVRSGAGSDVICGSPYLDVIEAGPGDDVVVAGRGHDRIRAGAGSDHVFGEGGNDVLDGGPGRDFLAGGAGRNRVVPHPRASDHGAAGDVVAQGWRGASFVTTAVSSDAVQAVVSFPPQSPTAQGLAPAWLSFAAYGGANYGVAIRDQPGVYWGLQRGADGLGLSLAPLQQGQVLTTLGADLSEWGTTWRFSVQPGGGQLIPVAEGGPAGIVNLRSPAVPSGQYAGGLALVGQTLDGSGFNPAQVGQFEASGDMAFGVGSRIVVQMPRTPVRTGTLLGPPASGVPSTVASITRSAPTAMLLIDPASGTVTR